ncbi:MAG: hypothetical protein E6J22_17640 [Chloroflexi bacterium]|nr:MAG: hypothetical protein E6J22_17640 [Chloroflexota bacterium]
MPIDSAISSGIPNSLIGHPEAATVSRADAHRRSTPLACGSAFGTRQRPRPAGCRRARESPSIYLHLSGLVARSARVATSMPTIMGAGIVPFVWLQAIHGVAPGSKRTAAIAPSSSAPRFTPSRGPRPGACSAACLLQSFATRRGTRQR